MLAEFAASLEWQLYSYSVYALGWKGDTVRKGILFWHSLGPWSRLVCPLT